MGVDGPARLVVVDDSADARFLVRTATAFDDRFELVAEARTAHEGVAGVARVQPDVVLLDCEMPGPTGIEAINAIREVSRRTIVVIWSMSRCPGRPGSRRSM